MTTTTPANPESVFTYGAPQLKFGTGASDEIGFDLSRYGVQRVLVVTDPGLSATGIPQRVADQMAQFGIEARVYDGVHIEPTDQSLIAAIEEARATGPWDAFVAVGGGSSIDTAKAINLLTTNPGSRWNRAAIRCAWARIPMRWRLRSTSPTRWCSCIVRNWRGMPARWCRRCATKALPCPTPTR